MHVHTKISRPIYLKGYETAQSQKKRDVLERKASSTIYLGNMFFILISKKTVYLYITDCNISEKGERKVKLVDILNVSLFVDRLKSSKHVLFMFKKVLKV
mgnify:CR=1 FL=1